MGEIRSKICRQKTDKNRQKIDKKQAEDTHKVNTKQPENRQKN